MLVLCIAILLAFMSVATYPCWSYSDSWSRFPSAFAGMLLLCVALLAVAGKSISKPIESERQAASGLAPTAEYGALEPQLARSNVRLD